MMKVPRTISLESAADTTVLDPRFSGNGIKAKRHMYTAYGINAIATRAGMDLVRDRLPVCEIRLASHRERTEGPTEGRMVCKEYVLRERYRDQDDDQEYGQRHSPIQISASYAKALALA